MCLRWINTSACGKQRHYTHLVIVSGRYDYLGPSLCCSGLRSSSNSSKNIHNIVQNPVITMILTKEGLSGMEIPSICLNSSFEIKETVWVILFS